jgi:hypothetical protein
MAVKSSGYMMILKIFLHMDVYMKKEKEFSPKPPKETLLTSKQICKLFGLNHRQWWELGRPTLLARGLPEYQLTQDKRTRRYPEAIVMKLHKDFQNKRGIA